MEEKQITLSMEHLMISSSRYVGERRRKKPPVIRDLSIRVREHEVVTVAGSSGPGKSLPTHMVTGLLPQNTACRGTVFFEGEILSRKRKEQLRGNQMVLVPQSVPYLDSLMKVGEQVRRRQRDEENVKRCCESLGCCGLGEDTKGLYPFELSGGITRRVLISTAAIEHSGLVIADEPTPGLHTRAARRMLNHFQEITDGGTGVPLIIYDLELVLEMADRIMVFYAGTNMEGALAADFEDEQRLRHLYTRTLFRATPRRGFKAASGIQPYAADIPAGCPYEPRCLNTDEGCPQETSYRSLRGSMVKYREVEV